MGEKQTIPKMRDGLKRSEGSKVKQWGRNEMTTVDAKVTVRASEEELQELKEERDQLGTVSGRGFRLHPLWPCGDELQRIWVDAKGKILESLSGHSQAFVFDSQCARRSCEDFQQSTGRLSFNPERNILDIVWRTDRQPLTVSHEKNL